MYTGLAGASPRTATPPYGDILSRSGIQGGKSNDLRIAECSPRKLELWYRECLLQGVPAFPCHAKESSGTHCRSPKTGAVGLTEVLLKTVRRAVLLASLCLLLATVAAGQGFDEYTLATFLRNQELQHFGAVEGTEANT